MITPIIQLRILLQGETESELQGRSWEFEVAGKKKKPSLLIDKVLNQREGWAALTCTAGCFGELNFVIEWPVRSNVEGIAWGPQGSQALTYNVTLSKSLSSPPCTCFLLLALSSYIVSFSEQGLACARVQKNRTENLGS